MTEEQQNAGDRQDPAEQYKTDQQVETSEQPEAPTPAVEQQDYVGPSQPVQVAPFAAPTYEVGEGGKLVERSAQTQVSPEQPADTSGDPHANEPSFDSAQADVPQAGTDYNDTGDDNRTGEGTSDSSDPSGS